MDEKEEISIAIFFFSEQRFQHYNTILATMNLSEYKIFRNFRIRLFHSLTTKRHVGEHQKNKKQVFLTVLYAYLNQGRALWIIIEDILMENGGSGGVRERNNHSRSPFPLPKSFLSSITFTLPCLELYKCITECQKYVLILTYIYFQWQE